MSISQNANPKCTFKSSKPFRNTERAKKPNQNEFLELIKQLHNAKKLNKYEIKKYNFKVNSERQIGETQVALDALYNCSQFQIQLQSQAD